MRPAKSDSDTGLIMEEAGNTNEKRKNLVMNLPFPMGELYKDLLLRRELDEDIAFFEIARLSASILKFLAAVSISDYIQYFDKKEWSSPEINRAILDYFKAPSDQGTHLIIKLILTGFKEQSLAPRVPGFLKLLEPFPPTDNLPQFINVQGSLLDTFLFFLQLEKEMAVGRFFLREPSKDIVLGYFELIEHILFNLYSIFDYPVFIPVKGTDFNCYATKGSTISTQKTEFANEEEFLDEYHFKAILYFGPEQFISLHPLLYLQDVSGGKGISAGNLLFLHRASESGYTYIDYQTNKEIPIAGLDNNLIQPISTFLRKLQAEAPREKRKRRPPLVHFEEFIDFHSRLFVGREKILSEIDEFIKERNQTYALLTGKEGHGKTALLCNFIYHNRKLPIVYHFVRKTADLDKPVVILRSLIAQLMYIKGSLDFAAGEIPHRIQDLVVMFREQLADTAKFCKKNNEKLIFILDSLDQIPYLRETLDIIPENLPDNVVGIISLETSGVAQDTGIDLHIKPDCIRFFTNCPLEPFTREEITLFIEKAGIKIKQKEKIQSLTEKIYWASRGGKPLTVRLIANSILCGQLTADTILSLPSNTHNMNMAAWEEHLDNDDFYNSAFLRTVYGPIEPEETTDQVLLYDILGALILFQHPVSDDDLAHTFKTDIFRIMKNRRRLNKFLILEKGNFSFSSHRIMDHIRPLYSPRDLIRIHKKIIDFYEVKKPRHEGYGLKSQVMDSNALRYLPLHYYLLGRLSKDYYSLFSLLSNDKFRLDQGLRLSPRDILESLELAINIAVENNDIKTLIKYGFLYDDIHSQGIKGGLSLIVSQAEEGNFKEAIEMARKIQDDAFRYKQLLFIVWLLARSNDFLKTMEILDEALMTPGSTFNEEDEDFIFAVVEEVIGIGIAEGLDLLTSGVSEKRIVNYYSRLADILSGYPDLVLNVVTGAAMQLRKISSEELKSKFILEFARINNKLDDEIKKRQFFENFIYEAKNLEDEQIRYRTLADLARIFADVDWARCEDILKEALLDLENMGPYSVIRFKQEAYYAGQVAILKQEKWASELFANAVSGASGLMVEKEKAEVFQEIARSLIHLQNSNARADFLEQLFSNADSFEELSHQAMVMVGISEVLSESDEDLLNIYLETFKYIDELPVDTAKNALCKIAKNMKIVREEEWFNTILTSFSAIVDYLRNPEEKAELFIAVGEGLCSAKAFTEESHYSYINGFIELTSEISGYDSEIHRGTALGEICKSVIDNNVFRRQDLITFAIQKATMFENENARLPVYQAISENIYKIGTPEKIEWTYEYLESVIRELQLKKIKGKALMSLTRGITRIENLLLRDRLTEAVITLAESVGGKVQSYRILSSLSGGLINSGESDEGIKIYKRALSQIPVKEEKAPDALGGVMAGLCRGITSYANQGWAREIYKRLLNRIDFIAPERKRLDVIEGIIDGLKALENQDLMRKYFIELSKSVQRFINPREKCLGFIRLAHSFHEIGDKEEARKNWERFITVATTLDEKENGELKAEKLAEALINIWKVGNTEWIEQAMTLISDCSNEMTIEILPVFIESVFKDIENLPSMEVRSRVLDLLISLIEKPTDSDETVLCIAAASRGIVSLEKIGLLQQILEHLVKSVKKIKKGISRVRAMAILARNFLDVGLGDWAKQSYDRIKKAYQKLKDKNIKAHALGEMMRIPFASKDIEWQTETYQHIIDDELPGFEGESREVVLESIMGTLARSQRIEWAMSKLDKILMQCKDPQSGLTIKIYHSLFGGFAEVGNIDSIFKYRNTIKNRQAWEISSQYIKKALLNLLNDDVVTSFRYFSRITDRKLKVELVQDFFNALMTDRNKFEGGDFLYLYHNLLSLAIYNRDTLDFVIGKVVSFYQDEGSLVEIAETLGVLERAKMKIVPTALLKPIATPEAAEIPEEDEIEEPLDLVADADQIGESADSSTLVKREEEPGQEDDSSATGFLHSKSTLLKKTMPAGPVPEVENIAEYLRNGYRLTRSHYFSEAKKYFDKAIELYPNDPRGYIGMGAAYYILRDYRQAAQYYIKAIEVKPDIDHLERFLKAVPRNAYLWFRFAKNLLLLKQYEEAIKVCDRVKAEGVYFDFVRKVDALRGEAIEKKEGLISVPRGESRWMLVLGIILVILGYCLASAGPWYYYINGNRSLKRAQERVKAYSEGMNYNEETEFSEYAFYFKKAVAFYDRIKKPTTMFDKKMFFEARLKKAKCKYLIGHYPVLNYQWQIVDAQPSDKGAEAANFREQAIDDLKRLLMDDAKNPQVLYYLGLCQLDNALVVPGADNLPRVKRKECFVESINYLIDSVNNLSGEESQDYYLMLAIAKINYYLFFKNKKTRSIAVSAVKDLDKAAESGDDPRVEAYRIAAYAMVKNKKKAVGAYKKAKELIETQYTDQPRRLQYWTRVTRKFRSFVVK